MKQAIRADLRLALTTGLVNGFTSLAGLPFGFYAALAVLAVNSGSYGGSLELGRQRILGSLLGGALLVVYLPGLQALPMPVGLAIALGSLRLIGGVLGLRVGYKVGGMILVMGWLVHDGQLETWLPLRLFWTVVGILLALLSLRLFWPARALAGCQSRLAELFDLLAIELERRGAAAGAAPPREGEAEQAQQRLQEILQAVRQQLPALAQELGSFPHRHPAWRLVEALEAGASQLLGANRALAAHPPQPPGAEPLLEGPQQLEAELLAVLAGRLRLWGGSLAAAQGRPAAPPEPPLALPEAWQELERRFAAAEINTLPVEQLQRLAIRYSLCRQARQAIEAAEAHWHLLGRGRGQRPAAALP